MSQEPGQLSVCARSGGELRRLRLSPRQSQAWDGGEATAWDNTPQLQVGRQGLRASSKRDRRGCGPQTHGVRASRSSVVHPLLSHCKRCIYYQEGRQAALPDHSLPDSWVDHLASLLDLINTSTFSIFRITRRNFWNKNLTT